MIEIPYRNIHSDNYLYNFKGAHREREALLYDDGVLLVRLVCCEDSTLAPIILAAARVQTLE